MEAGRDALLKQRYVAHAAGEWRSADRDEVLALLATLDWARRLAFVGSPDKLVATRSRSDGLRRPSA